MDFDFSEDFGPASETPLQKLRQQWSSRRSWFDDVREVLVRLIENSMGSWGKTKQFMGYNYITY
jgi:hypothetical protein